MKRKIDERRVSGPKKMQKAKERHQERVREQLPIYGGLYKKVYSENENGENECIYCGEAGYLLKDYAPPITILNEKTVKLYKTFTIYQACTHCHAILRSYRRVKFETRIKFLKKNYAKKIKNSKTPWSKKQYEELGYNLRSYIEANPIHFGRGAEVFDEKLKRVNEKYK